MPIQEILSAHWVAALAADSVTVIEAPPGWPWRRGEGGRYISANEWMTFGNGYAARRQPGLSQTGAASVQLTSSEYSATWPFYPLSRPGATGYRFGIGP